jgi:hypothetical protein
MRVRRLPVLDEYVEDGDAALFVDGRVIALSALATRVLHVVGEDVMGVEQVAQALVDAFGPPPDGGAAMGETLDAVRQLAALGLLAVE